MSLCEYDQSKQGARSATRGELDLCLYAYDALRASEIILHTYIHTYRSIASPQQLPSRETSSAQLGGQRAIRFGATTLLWPGVAEDVAAAGGVRQGGVERNLAVAAGGEACRGEVACTLICGAVKIYIYAL